MDLKQNNRLTTMNQWGDILYCGPNHKNDYKCMGEYPENLSSEKIELILKKLYYFEENLEDLLEVLKYAE